MFFLLNPPRNSVVTMSLQRAFLRLNKHTKAITGALLVNGTALKAGSVYFSDTSSKASSGPTHYLISGYPECRFFQKAERVGKAYAAKFPEQVAVKVEALDYERFHAYREQQLVKLGKAPDSHKTSPLVYTFAEKNGEVVPVEFVGGCDSTVALFTSKFGVLPEATGPLWK